MGLITLYTTTNTNRRDLLTPEQWLDMLYSGAEVTQSLGTAHSEHFFNTQTFLTTQLLPRHEQRCTRMLSTLTMNLDNLETIINQFKAVHPDYETMYEEFHIPKSSGGYRLIQAPHTELSIKQRLIAETLFSHSAGIYTHDCAYAYTPGRSVKDALIAHQDNHSEWFAKFDMKNFFPNTTLDFVMRMLKELYPFEMLSTIHEAKLRNILSIGFKDGGLPQGTPLSPILTNMMMIPFDHQMQGFAKQYHFVYTRYADDILVSAVRHFPLSLVKETITGILETLQAPFTLKHEKTRYGSSAGSNWNLGLMLNKEGNITIGHKRKQRIRAAINNFLNDFTNNSLWTIIDTQTLMGELAWLRNIEPDYANFIVQRLEQKYNLNLQQCMLQIIR